MSTLQSFLSDTGIDPFDLLFRNALKSTVYQPFSVNTKLNYPCDIYFNDEFMVFDIPVINGKIEDIKVTKVDGELCVSYHRSDKPTDSGTYLNRGIVRRNFDFSWKISSKFDLENLHANYQNGLLSIQIPWAKRPLPQEVPILDLSYSKLQSKLAEEIPQK